MPESTTEIPVGTRVHAYPDTREGRRLVTRTRSVVWRLGDGTEVVAVDGYAGGIALTHIDVIDEAPSDRKTIHAHVILDTDELRDWAGKHAALGHAGIAHVLYETARELEAGRVPEFLTGTACLARDDELLDAAYPACSWHKEVQHRDGNVPWCRRCGWTRGRSGWAPRRIGAADGEEL